MTQSLSLQGLEREIRKKLVGGKEINRLLEQGSLKSVRAFVKLVGGCVEDLNRRVGLVEPAAVFVREAVLQGAFPSLVFYYWKHFEEASRFLVGTWETYAGPPETDSARVPAELSRTNTKLSKQMQSWFKNSAEEAEELLALFHVAVSEEITGISKLSRGRLTIRRFMSSLGLSYDDVGRVFGVSGETARRWDRGASKIADDQLARLDQAEDVLRRLLKLFRPDRLSQVIRRRAELFDGESAVDWILRGRLEEVASRYELALSFQA